MPFKAPIEVAAALIFASERLLIAQRPPGVHLEGLWEFPGGKLELGESYPDCVRRELQEELRVEVRVGPMLAAVEHHYPEKLVRIQFYRCELLDGEPMAVECSDLAWVSAEELDQYVFPPADAGIISELKARPDLWGDQN